VPKAKRLWSKVEPAKGGVKKKMKRGVRADKTYELKDRECTRISAALSDDTDVTGALTLKANTKPKVVFEGVQTGHDGFVLSADEAEDLLAKDSRHNSYVKPFINGTDLLSGRYLIKREYVIDMSQLDAIQASSIPELLKFPKERVLSDWQSNAAQEAGETGKSRGEHQNRLDAWWALKRPRMDLQRAISKLSRYIACSAVMKRPIFVFIDKTYLPTNALKIFTFDDDWSYGVVQSNVHFMWFEARCSNLTERLRYTPESVSDTFPWPQGSDFLGATPKQVDAVAVAACELRRVRDQALKVIKGGLRAVYRTMEMPGKHPLKDAHAALDAAVLAAYGFSAKKDLLQQLLDLNRAVADREKNGLPVTAPGVPPSYGDPAALITEDCIRP
jgi:hypothetical protein